MTDPDREGEAIAWHASAVIPETFHYNKGFKILRATTTEITKSGVMKAIN